MNIIKNIVRVVIILKMKSVTIITKKDLLFKEYVNKFMKIKLESSKIKGKADDQSCVIDKERKEFFNVR